jgi:uncharacterized protein (DUF433 family)
MRVTAAMVVSQLAAGHSAERILQAYPYLEPQDIQAALADAAAMRSIRKPTVRQPSFRTYS